MVHFSQHVGKGRLCQTLREISWPVDEEAHSTEMHPVTFLAGSSVFGQDSLLR